MTNLFCALIINAKHVNLDTIKVIAFDADDTLWVNETIFRNAEKAFAKKLSYLNYSEDEIIQILLDTEIKNLGTYGYGIKGRPGQRNACRTG